MPDGSVKATAPGPAGWIVGAEYLHLKASSLGGDYAYITAPGPQQAGSLTLDPTSAGYGTRGGVAVIDTGLWVYHLTPVGTGQIALTSAPDTEVFEFAELSTALGPSDAIARTARLVVDLLNGPKLVSGITLS